MMLETLMWPFSYIVSGTGIVMLDNYLNIFYKQIAQLVQS